MGGVSHASVSRGDTDSAPRSTRGTSPRQPHQHPHHLFAKEKCMAVKVRSFSTAMFCLAKSELLLDVEVVGGTPVFVFPESTRHVVGEYIKLMDSLNERVALVRAEAAEAPA